jgi:hypothetical protein
MLNVVKYLQSQMALTTEFWREEAHFYPRAALRLQEVIHIHPLRGQVMRKYSATQNNISPQKAIHTIYLIFSYFCRQIIIAYSEIRNVHTF